MTPAIHHDAIKAQAALNMQYSMTCDVIERGADMRLSRIQLAGGVWRKR